MVVGSNPNVIYKREMCGKDSSMAAGSKRIALHFPVQNILVHYPISDFAEIILLYFGASGQWSEWDHVRSCDLQRECHYAATTSDQCCGQTRFSNIYSCIYVYVHVNVYIFMHIHISIYVYIHFKRVYLPSARRLSDTHAQTHTHSYVSSCIVTHVCINIYIYTHTQKIHITGLFVFTGPHPSSICICINTYIYIHT